MRLGKLLLTAVIFAAFMLFLIYDREISAAALAALSVAVEKVIPSLFPFMVLSSMIVSLGLADSFGKIIPTKLFSLPQSSAAVILTGILCGFPVGAVGSAELYRSGHITKDEAARLCAISCHVSPAFLIGVVATVWGSKAFGIFLFFFGVLYALISGVIMGAKKSSVMAKIKVAPTEIRQSAVTVFCRAVSDSASSCLFIRHSVRSATMA